MADTSIEMRMGGQTDGGAKAGGFQRTPGRAPGESSTDFEREDGPSSVSRPGAPESPLQNPMYIGGAVAAAVVFLLIIGFAFSGGSGQGSPTPTPPGEPPAISPADMERFRSVVDSACEKQVYKSPSELTHLEHFMAQFVDLCSSKGHTDAVIESPTSTGDFLLKARGPLQHDLYFKPLTEGQKDNFLNFWKEKELKERSYMIPLVAIVEKDGQAWGVEPSPYLDTGKKGKTYGIRGEGHGEWEFDFDTGPVKMTMEHWEKMTIRLSEDVSNLLQHSNSQYKMQVTVLGEEEKTKQSSLGKHVWSVKDGKGDSHGLLFGGVTDYLASPRPDEDNKKDDAIRACKFFLYISTQMVTPCRSAHDGDDPSPTDDCIKHFDGLFKEILGSTLPEKNADKLDKVCEAVEMGGDASKVMGFEAQLLQHALETLEGDIPCEGRFRRPENCVESFEYEGKQKSGCVSDAFLFEDIKAPWCSWKKKMDGGADWDGPWSFCVRCTEKKPDRPDDGGDVDPEGPGPDVDEDDGVTAVKALCSLEETDDIPDLDPSMKETMKQIRALCKKGGGTLDTTKVTGSQRPLELLVKAQGPLQTDVSLFALLDSEKEQLTADGMPKNPTPVPHSLLVPLIASFNEGDLVWGVMPSTQLDASASSRVGGLKKSYKIGGMTSSAASGGLPHWKGFQEDYPKGLGVSMEHWAKLIVRLVEDMQILKEMGSISYALEVGVHSRMPEEDTAVKNALGKHVLRAYDFKSKGEVGMLAGGVVDYMKEERLSQVGVSSAVYACEFLLFVTTEMLVPCQWPQDQEAPKEAKCVTDFTELWPKLVKSDADVKGDNDKFLAQICQSLNDETNFLQDVGKMLEFVDIKLNGEKPCVDGFRKPEHCHSSFEYEGDSVTDCSKEELFADIKAPWCSWKPKLESGVEWDGPWSFCTHCPDDPDHLDRRIVV